MKYAVDKIENDIALLESLVDKNKIEIDIRLLPNNVKERDIVVFDGDKYLLDNKEKEDRLKKLKEKMNKLKE